jgi:hypothetical protein
VLAKVGTGRLGWQVAVGRWSWSMVGCVGAAPATGVADPDLSVSARKRTPAADAPMAGAYVDDRQWGCRLRGPEDGGCSQWRRVHEGGRLQW